MPRSTTDGAALAAARASGLIASGEPLLVLVSGGADSTCLLDVAIRLGARVRALHVNYGLRADADADEAHCRALCERLGAPLHAERVSLGEGNLQAAARDARYALAERLATGDYATAHTASDQAETVLYRLATSPGPRALVGMRARRGRLVRPLLAATHEDTRAHCEAAGLDWREDASNADTRFARARVRHGLLPALRAVAPQAERSIVRTADLVADDEALLDTLAREALDRVGERPRLADLRTLAPALRRRALALLAEAALPEGHVEAVLGLADTGSASHELPGGVRAVAEYGRLRFTRAREDDDAPAPARLELPGAARFGDWEVVARAGGDGEAAVGPGVASVALRAWRAGDRMRPAGLGGTRKLQDLFTDRKVPRAERHALPVVCVGGEIAWVPGVAVAEGFTPTGRAGEFGLRARIVPDA